VSESYMQQKIVPPWLSATATQQSPVISTRVRLARNLENFNFLSMLPQLQRREIYEQLMDFCRQKLLLATRCDCVDSHPQAAQWVTERGFFDPLLVSNPQISGVSYDESQGRSVLVHNTDHVRIALVDQGICGKRLFNACNGIDSLFDRNYAWAFDSRRGYLTANPAQCGTGLQISYLAFLPGLVLTNRIDQVLSSASQMGMSACGYFSGGLEVTGYSFLLSNAQSLGRKELEFIEETQQTIKSISTAEMDARADVVSMAKKALVDKMYRAYGILTHARSLSESEAINLCSVIRLGVELGFTRRYSVQTIQRLMLIVLCAQLQKLYDTTDTDDKLDELRAELLRGVFTQNGL